MDSVINPHTGRRVKVGSQTYRRLINEGILEEERKNTYTDDEYKRHLLHARAGLTTGGHAVGKINKTRAIDATTSAAARMFAKHRHLFTDDMDDAEINKLVKALTTAELMKTEKTTAKGNMYKVRAAHSDDDDSEDDEEEYDEED